MVANGTTLEYVTKSFEPDREVYIEARNTLLASKDRIRGPMPDFGTNSTPIERVTPAPIGNHGAMTASPLLHPDVRHLAFLLGHWAGGGTGHYPTIADFEYREQVWFDHVGKPFISYRQATKDAHTGLPLHAEVGYLRPVGTDRVELVVAQPSGIVELHEGLVDGTTIRLATTSVVTTATAKDVSAVERSVVVTEDELSYDLSMAAVGLPLQHHLSARLMRS